MHMSIFKKNTTKKEIETSLNEIQINLENNYKDLAIKAFKDSSELVERYHNVLKKIIIYCQDIYTHVILNM